MLAAGLDKFLSLASLVSMPFGGTYAAESLKQCLGDLCGCPGRLLGAFWVLSEASGMPIKASRKLLGTPSGILEPSCTSPGASCEHGGDISSALGAVGEAS